MHRSECGGDAPLSSDDYFYRGNNGRRITIIKKKKSGQYLGFFLFGEFISVALSINRTVATKRAIKIATKFTGIKKTLVL